MTPEEKREYELALKISQKRFGSPCDHLEVKNGICCNCLRRVITLQELQRGNRNNRGIKRYEPEM